MAIDIESLKARTDLRALIGETVALKQKGRVLMACCPFHSERSPSFVVYEKSYHCYGCGEHGDAIDWLQKMFSLDFNTACGILGGHSTYDASKPILIKRERTPEVAIDPEPLWREWSNKTSKEAIRGHAVELGVLFASLLWLGAAWAPERNAWAFPQRDASEKIIGIRFRNVRAEKWALTGGKAGLFIPDCQRDKVLYIAEGPTDTAALLTLGFYAIGRPSCLGQEDMVAEFVKANRISRTIIVSDNDSPKKRKDGDVFYPGIEGARRLQESIPVRSCIWIPEAKDVREWLSFGGTAQMLESDVKNLIWSNPK